MQIKYISVIISIGLIIIFTLQNTEPVEVNFLFWKSEASLALIIAIILLMGALVGLLFSIPSGSKKKKEKE